MQWCTIVGVFVSAQTLQHLVRIVLWAAVAAAALISRRMLPNISLPEPVGAVPLPQVRRMLATVAVQGVLWCTQVALLVFDFWRPQPGENSWRSAYGPTAFTTLTTLAHAPTLALAIQVVGAVYMLRIRNGATR